MLSAFTWLSTMNLHHSSLRVACCCFYFTNALERLSTSSCSKTTQQGMQRQDLPPSSGAITTLDRSISQVSSLVPGGPPQVQSSDPKVPLGLILTLSSLSGDAAAQDSNPPLLYQDPLASLFTQFLSAQTHTFSRYKSLFFFLSQPKVFF